MKTTDISAYLDLHVNTLDNDDLRGAISQLEGHLRANAGPSTYGSKAQLKTFAESHGLKSIHGIQRALTHAVYVRWLFLKGLPLDTEGTRWKEFLNERQKQGCDIHTVGFYSYEVEDEFLTWTLTEFSQLSEKGKAVVAAYVCHMRETDG